MRRSLSLKRETLAELTATELVGVAGGAQLSGPTCPALECVSNAHLCDITFQPRCFAP
ncbi:MAG TPA: hypothetical protein VNQ77_05535 [Frankiaceae bacterium]|nr:hypothetical protein [Frankiaceae bacterium]